MQPKPLPPPPGQSAPPFEVPRRAGPRMGPKEVVAGRCAPQEAWDTLEPAGRERLRKAWLRVLKEVVGDARDR